MAAGSRRRKKDADREDRPLLKALFDNVDVLPVRVAEKLLSYEPVGELRQGNPSQRCCGRCHEGEEHRCSSPETQTR